MNLFKFSEEDATEELTDAQLSKKKLKRKSQRMESEPIFSGKVNLKLNDVENSDEVWLIKVPKKVNFKAYILKNKLEMNFKPNKHE